jgi:hypothetical protein
MSLACTRTRVVISVPVADLLPGSQPMGVPDQQDSTVMNAAMDRASPAMLMMSTITQPNPSLTMNPGHPTTPQHGLLAIPPPPSNYYSAGPPNHITLLSSPNTDVFGTCDPISNLTEPAQSSGQKRVHSLADAEPEQGAGKRQKLLTGSSLPVVYVQQLAHQGFQSMHDETGTPFINPQGHGPYFRPTHQPPWQSTGVAGPSFTRPVTPQVMSNSNSGGVSVHVPPHSDDVLEADHPQPPTHYSTPMEG